MTSLAEVAQALREAHVVRLSMISAFQPGDVVFVETTRPLSAETMQQLRRSVEGMLADTGVKIVVLGDALRIVGREEHMTVTPP